MKLTLATVALVVGFAFTARAEEAAPEGHEQHHAADKAEDKKSEGMMNHGMMGGKMDMGKMHEMMGECMKMHKDGKMCEGQTMEECQKNMGKDECAKMMKKASSKKSK